MKEIEGRRITLIGGAGFIGHNLALELKSAGAEVSVIDSLMVNNLLAFTSTETDVEHRELYLDILNQRLNLVREAKIPLYVQDVRDYHALSKLLARLNPEVVVHLAAIAHANQSNIGGDHISEDGQLDQGGQNQQRAIFTIPKQLDEFLAHQFPNPKPFHRLDPLSLEKDEIHTSQY